jgi:hypothetical protein
MLEVTILLRSETLITVHTTSVILRTCFKFRLSSIIPCCHSILLLTSIKVPYIECKATTNVIMCNGKNNLCINFAQEQSKCLLSSYNNVTCLALKSVSTVSNWLSQWTEEPKSKKNYLK